MKGRERARALKARVRRLFLKTVFMMIYFLSDSLIACNS
jgi:hypothetical protein